MGGTVDPAFSGRAHRILGFEGLTVVFFCGLRYLTRTLPEGSAATEAKAEWCNVLQLLRLEVRYHRYSGFSGGVDHNSATQAVFCQGTLKLALTILLHRRG